ncbi:uncharacterized protein [Ptychodera flava]|uniref:uncharacterized protein n=1 Tax=Ptychodera flava TaxID=63121 RepID=UPI00396A584A
MTGQRPKRCEMNHFFCNLHVLIGAATYCDKAMKQLEEVWREKYGKLGVEGLREFQDKTGQYSWKHTDSATQRLIRTVSDAVAPGGDQKSGCIGHFATYRSMHSVSSCQVVPFRANRFNVMFKCAAGTYYHHRHISQMFSDGYVKAGNKLLRAVQADVACRPLLAGARALGILHKHITEPYWEWIENDKLHIIEGVTPQVQQLQSLLTEWSDDATPLLSRDIPALFKLDDNTYVPVKKDSVFDALYQDVDSEVQTLTKQALEVCCSALTVLLERRFIDQLHGKYSIPDNVSDQTKEETSGMPKSNKRGENDSGYWAYVKQIKPSIGPMAAEGSVMYRCNDTAQWLDGLSDDHLNKVMRKARTERRNWMNRYKERQMATEKQKEELMKQQAKEQENKSKRKSDQLREWLEKINEHGGECKSAEDVDVFVQNLKTKTKQLSGLKAHINFCRETYRFDSEIAPLMKFSRMGKQLTVEELTSNLKLIIETIKAGGLKPVNEKDQDVSIASSSLPELTEEQQEEMTDMISRIKANFSKEAIGAS